MNEQHYLVKILNALEKSGSELLLKASFFLLFHEIKHNYWDTVPFYEVCEVFPEGLVIGIHPLK